MDEIQERALNTWYAKPHPLYGDWRPAAMGLSGESGELLDLIKKHYYKPEFCANLSAIKDELGDVLFYLSILAHYAGLTLDELSQRNYDKLAAREAEGTGYNRGE